MVRWFIGKVSELYIDLKFKGSIAAARDFAERKRAEEELSKYRNKLDELKPFFHDYFFSESHLCPKAIILK